MERYRPRSERNKTPPPPSGSAEASKPNGQGGDPITDALGAEEITPESARIAEALTAFSTDAAQLGRTLFEAIGSWVWVASDGSDEGRALFDEWSKPWLYYSADGARRHWEYCAKYPPRGVDADMLFKQADKVRERKCALDEAARLDDVAYAEQRKTLKEKTGLSAGTLDAERKRRRKRKEPPPPPKPTPIEELAEAAADIIACDDILGLFVKDISRRLAGAGDGNAELLYLAFTSRLFDKPMSVVEKGESAIGKSYGRNCVLAYIPEEDICRMTTMSDKALSYLPNNMAHQILSIAEAAGLKDYDDEQEYVLREIISEGRITRWVAVPGERGEVPTARQVVIEGPIMFITTTTRARLHPEIETRVLSIEGNDTVAQTRRVIKKVAELEGGLIKADKVDPKWPVFQRWLAAGERRVVVPYHEELAKHEKLYDRSVRMRRDFSQVLTTIKAHALLHRAHRKLDDEGRIKADRFDYEVAYDLLADRLAQSAGVAIKTNDRRVFEAIQELQKRLPKTSEGVIVKGEGVTVADLVADLDLNQTTVNRRLAKLIANGMVENLNPGKGKTGRYRAIKDEPDQQVVLPKPDELFSVVGEG